MMTAETLSEYRKRCAAIEAESVHWPLASPSSQSRGRVMCPACGAAGWPKGSWTHTHLEHVVCDCGLYVTVRGLTAHLRGHRNHRSP